MGKMSYRILFLHLCLSSFSLQAQNPWDNWTPDPDERVQVSEEEPHRYACYISFKRGWSSARGSGFLIHPRLVLTAGHNQAFYPASKYFPWLLSYVTQAELYFGSTDTESYIVSEHVRLRRGQRKVHKNVYWLKGSIDRDYSLIVLPDSSVYEAVGGYFKIAPVGESELAGKALHITGSPGDKASGELWTSSAHNHEQNAQSLYYDIYTKGGNSGSVIWTKEGNAYRAVGIHSRKFNDQYNGALLINQEVYDQIKAWAAEAGIELD